MPELRAMPVLRATKVQLELKEILAHRETLEHKGLKAAKAMLGSGIKGATDAVKGLFK